MENDNADLKKHERILETYKLTCALRDDLLIAIENCAVRVNPNVDTAVLFDAINSAFYTILKDYIDIMKRSGAVIPNAFQALSQDDIENSKEIISLENMLNTDNKPLDK